MPLEQGKFNEDFSGIEYGDCADAKPDLTFPSVERTDTGIPDLTFPPMERIDEDIPDLGFPSTDSGFVVQPSVDENKSVGVLSHIRGWLGKE